MECSPIPLEEPDRVTVTSLVVDVSDVNINQNPLIDVQVTRPWLYMNVVLLQEFHTHSNNMRPGIILIIPPQAKCDVEE